MVFCGTVEGTNTINCLMKSIVRSQTTLTFTPTGTWLTLLQSGSLESAISEPLTLALHRGGLHHRVPLQAFTDFTTEKLTGATWGEYGDITIEAKPEWKVDQCIQSRPIQMRIYHSNESCSQAYTANFAPAAYFSAAILFFLPFCE